MIKLAHGRITLALHALREASGGTLLHLHGLGLRSPEETPNDLASWPGSVYALDFTGHGDSTIPRGGGYTPEVLMGDVDAAIEQLGTVTLLGRGLGAYVALLAGGARANAVHGVILCDGPGIAGGGSLPGTPTAVRPDPNAPAPPDPFALAELAKDLRPPDYATSFARLLVTASDLQNAIAVCAKARPEWLRTVADEPGVAVTTLDTALRMFSG